MYRPSTLGHFAENKQNLCNVLINLLDYFYFHSTEAVVQRCSVKKVFLGISQKSQENTCARVSFSIKLQASRPEACNFIKKRDSSAGVFM